MKGLGWGTQGGPWAGGEGAEIWGVLAQPLNQPPLLSPVWLPRAQPQHTGEGQFLCCGLYGIYVPPGTSQSRGSQSFSAAVEMKAKSVGAARGAALIPGFGMKGRNPCCLQSLPGEWGLTPDQRPSRGINDRTEAAGAIAAVKKK